MTEDDTLIIGNKPVEVYGWTAMKMLRSKPAIFMMYTYGKKEKAYELAHVLRGFGIDEGKSEQILTKSKKKKKLMAYRTKLEKNSYLKSIG